MSSFCTQQCPVLQRRRAECSADECSIVGQNCVPFGAPEGTTDCLAWCCERDTATIALIVVICVVVGLACIACIAFLSLRYCCRNRGPPPDDDADSMLSSRKGPRSAMAPSDAESLEHFPIRAGRRHQLDPAPSTRYGDDMSVAPSSFTQQQPSMAGAMGNSAMRDAQLAGPQKDVWDASRGYVPAPRRPEDMYEDLDISHGDFSRRSSFIGGGARSARGAAFSPAATSLYDTETLTEGETQNPFAPGDSEWALSEGVSAYEPSAFEGERATRASVADVNFGGGWGDRSEGYRSHGDASSATRSDSEFDPREPRSAREESLGAFEVDEEFFS